MVDPPQIGQPPDMRSRPRRAVGLSEVQEGRKAPGSDDAPACPALAPAAAAGKLNAKLKSDFRCYPDNGHAATASAGPFCADFVAEIGVQTARDG